jgi:hypothetical protein
MGGGFLILPVPFNPRGKMALHKRVEDSCPFLRGRHRGVFSESEEGEGRGWVKVMMERPTEGNFFRAWGLYLQSLP